MNLLLAEVERYASRMQTISTFAAELSHRRRGMLRIVALPAMAMGFLPRFVASFIAGRSLASVYLHGMPSYLVVEAVALGQAEIGFAAAPPERPGLLIEPLESKAMLVVPLLHRLARRRSVTSLRTACEGSARRMAGTISKRRARTSSSHCVILGNGRNTGSTVKVVPSAGRSRPRSLMTTPELHASLNKRRKLSWSRLSTADQ